LKESRIYLHLAIAQSGLASRRKAEKLIRAGRVKVNNLTILLPEYRVNPKKDYIFIDNKKIKPREKKVYFLLNKPRGVISAAFDKRKQKTVIDLLPSYLKERVYPVGRLDKDTTGLLILTNDGELTFHLTHPKFKIGKTYTVVCRGKTEKADLSKLEKGIEIDGKKTLPAKIKNVEFNRQKKQTKLSIEIYEGRKRQIKKMFSKLGHPVVSLERIKYANLSIGSLKRGKIRPLTKSEIEYLKRKAGVSA
jgi:23S rRNA pseudouridine2605 synthase